MLQSRECGVKGLRNLVGENQELTVQSLPPSCRTGDAPTTPRGAVLRVRPAPCRLNSGCSPPKSVLLWVGRGWVVGGPWVGPWAPPPPHPSPLGPSPPLCLLCSVHTPPRICSDPGTPCPESAPLWVHPAPCLFHSRCTTARARSAQDALHPVSVPLWVHPASCLLCSGYSQPRGSGCALSCPAGFCLLLIHYPGSTHGCPF